jgi:secreted PhoX family phosphatase
MKDEHPLGSNPTDNPTLAEVAGERYSRRSVLGGGLGSAAVLLAGTAGSGLLAACAPPPPGGPAPSKLIGFTSIPASSADAVSVAPGYTVDVLVPWGTPLRSTGPAWNKDGSNSTADQEQQLGMNHDGMHYFPLASGERGNRAGLLVLNHEYVDQQLLFPDGPTPMTADKVAKALAAHGVTIVRVELRNGTWQVVNSPYNRRITGKTPVAFSGPVGVDHPMLQSNNPPLGTLNNCAHGYTPWGTYLTCEENFNGYFGTTDTSWVRSAHEARYGITASGFGYNWHLADPRFDVAVNGNELNRFGWVVEIDPFDPDSTPVKRTSLGRFKHEGAFFTESTDGRAVVYSGDDENRDYLYKYVSPRPWRRMISRGQSPLDGGTLYVARFDEDGSGRWLPLVHGTGPLTAANGFVDQADVLIRTRQAADAVGATRLDRPEWITQNPKTGVMYCALTNGTSGPNPANPRNPNPYGHILEWRETRDDTASRTFEWEIFALAGDPAYDPQVNIKGDIYGSPDGIWCDPDGRLWIQTDISNSSQLRADRGYDNIGNNQMLAADPETGETRRFLVGPRGCEITGVITTPDQTTMFVNVQHPGEATSAVGAPTPANPRAVSNWPDFDPDGRPRSATLVIRKADGGKIGT